MAKPILIRNARQLLTLRGRVPMPRRGEALRDLGIIPDGALLIRDGLIDEVGPSRRVEALRHARDADEVDAAGCVVMPGFVDCHTHLVTGAKRSADPWDTAIQQTSQRTLEARGLAVLEDFVRHGTTMIEAKSGFGFDQAGELKILRTQAALKRRTSMLASTLMGTLWLPPGASSGDYVDWMCSMLPLLKAKGLAEFADIRCEPDVFSLEQSRRYLNAARRCGFVPKMQTGETPIPGAVQEAVLLGAAAVGNVVFVTGNDIEMLAGSTTIATLLPGPAFFTGHDQYAPARRLIDAGAVVALATGHNPRTSPSSNMQMMIVLACRRMEMTEAEAISAATINAAYAMKRGASRGSLEPGKIADVVILRISDYREIASHFGVNLVKRTLLGGSVVFEREKIDWQVVGGLV